MHLNIYFTSKNIAFRKRSRNSFKRFLGMKLNWRVLQVLRYLVSRLWRWRTALDYKMPSSPDTLRVPLTRYAVVIKVINYTGLWDAVITWYSPSATRQIYRGHEGDEPSWSVRDAVITWYSPSATRQIYRGHEGDEQSWSVRDWAHLILSKCYSPDLSRSWRWRTILECERLSSPDTLRVPLDRFTTLVCSTASESKVLGRN